MVRISARILTEVPREVSQSLPANPLTPSNDSTLAHPESVVKQTTNKELTGTS
jgi:hypothetical protein